MPKSDAARHAAELGEGQKPTGGQQREADDALQVEHQVRHPHGLHRREDAGGERQQPEVAARQHGHHRPPRARRRRRQCEVGRIVIDEHAGDGAGGDQQGGGHERRAPPERERQRREERGPQHAAQRQADLLESDQCRPVRGWRPRHDGLGRGGIQHAVAEAGGDEQQDERGVRVRGAGGQQAHRGEDLPEDEQALDAPAIDQRAGWQRDERRADVVHREKGAGLREGQAEVGADQRGDGGDAEGTDVGHRLGDHDQHDDADARAHRRAVRRASAARRSSSVSTPIVGVGRLAHGDARCRSRGSAAARDLRSARGWTAAGDGRRRARAGGRRRDRCACSGSPPRPSRSNGMPYFEK